MQTLGSIIENMMLREQIGMGNWDENRDRVDSALPELDTDDQNTLFRLVLEAHRVTFSDADDAMMSAFLSGIELGRELERMGAT